MTTHLAKNNRQFRIRQATEVDAQAVIDYSRIVFASTDQLLTTPDEYTITIEEEMSWINNFNKNPNARLLVAEMDDQIVGLLFFIANPKKKNSHTGELGVNVHPNYQGLGIGRALVETLLKWAMAHEQIEKVFLHVFGTNLKAIKLYEGLGFRQEGLHVNAVKQLDGQYIDVIQMYIETKRTSR